MPEPAPQAIRVSVAMCTCEGAGYVGEQLSSILDQTRPPDEIVVWDDASTDETLRVVNDVAEQSLVPFRIFAGEQRVGHRDNFDRAMGACTGDVVFLSDQDDVWMPSKIEKLLACFNSPGTVLAYCDATVTDAQLQPVGGTVFENHRKWRTGQERRPVDLARAGGIPGCQMALSKGLVRMCRPLSGHWSHDPWIALISGAVGQVAPVAEPLQLYRRHPSAVSRNMRIDRNPLSRLKQRAGIRSIAVYKNDLLAWEDLIDRLEELGSRASFVDPLQFREFLDEYRRRKEVAAKRYRLATAPRWKRLVPVLSMSLAGDYARYLRPVGTPAKDLLRGRCD